MRPGEPPDALTIRTKAGLTQSGLAKLVRTSTSVISRLEVRNKVPRLAVESAVRVTFRRRIACF